ncbi:MAG: hypothetical protein FJX23_02840 [Alphaproteobacteria bacterium]|nr:hypothetical protein [Alphaproteobacteria bacterium]
MKKARRVAEAASEKLKDNTIRGQIMALLEMGDNAGRGEYDFEEVRLSADGALDFLAEQLAKRPQARKLKMDDCGLRIGNTADVLKVLDAAPNLEKFTFRKTMLDGAWAEKLLDGIKSHPSLTTLDISQNPLDGRGGAALAGFIASAPRIRSIQADACRLGDEGIEAVSKAIGSAGDKLLKVSFNHNHLGKKGMRAFAHAVTRDNRSLIQVSCDNGDDATNKLLENAFLRAPSPNLLGIEPRTEEIVQIVHKNDAAVKHAVMVLQGEIGQQVPRRLQFMEDRKSAIFESGLLHIGTVPPEQVKQEYEAFLESLPKVPENATIDALFTPDARGFAPLDNPRAWNGKDALAVLSDLPLTPETLRQKTPKGTSLLNALSHAVDADVLIPHLNSRGIKLGAKDLREGDSPRPSWLMETLSEKGSTSALFGADNLMGKSRQEVMGMFALVPERQREDISIQSVLSRLSRSGGTLGR